MDTTAATSADARARGRGRGRGGLGKYLRARGKRGPGLRAEWGKRDGGGEDEVDSEEERAELAKYSRRALTSNEDRYKEPEVDPNLEAEAEPEPEIDLAALTAKQLALAERAEHRSPDRGGLSDDEDVDASILAKSGAAKPRDRAQEANSRKGKIVLVEWDDQIDELVREKAAAEALSDLKARLKKQGAAPKSLKPSRKKEKEPVLPPPLDQSPPAKDEKQSMQDFLDDLLT
ncbi:hypothetical protein EXIGLDRAFT_831563 [Exidia glandulosa HHB12029]|uniref:Uncharacterized protein n=1 Tax=Exidia glandulosa HHB12029 TaxID=1314781 RepID=A0A166B9P4_EXIGL|nr:hypothetical protein EXIGLDRAFT_831563 [Exidia glandulosa HHB12029]